MNINGAKQKINYKRYSYIKRGVYTEYRCGKGRYCGYIIGNSHKDIDNKILKRGLGEKTISQFMNIKTIPDFSTVPLKKIDLVDFAHAVTFMGLIAINANATTPKRLLSDIGLLHHVIHLMRADSAYDYSEVNIQKQFKMLKRKAIGCF